MSKEMSKEMGKEVSKETGKEMSKETGIRSISELRKHIDAEDAKVFYKDVAMICDDYLPEWRESLENSIVNFGVPFINMFVFSHTDSVYIIKQKGPTATDQDGKSYDIGEKTVIDRKQKICRQYKAYTFFSSKNFSKYIKSVFETCTYKIIIIDANTFGVRLDLN